MEDPHARSLRTAAYVLHFTPQEKAELERKAALYHARTGRRMTLAAALREGAKAHLDQLLREEGQVVDVDDDLMRLVR